MHEKFFTVKELASILKISVSTIYRDPAKFHMFRVGRSWRANAESLEKFASDSAQPKRVPSAVVKSKSWVPRNLASNLQIERELAALLAPKRKKKS